MSALGVTIIDPIVLVVVFISAVYATYRGFVSETLSIFAWAAAAFATLFFGPKLAPVARGLFASPLLGVLAGYAAIFLVVLLPLSFMSFRFAQSVKNSQVGTLDRSLGAVFGVVRGLAIIGLAYIAFSSVIPVRHQPDWVAGAKTLPLIQVSAEALLSLVPDQHLGDRREQAAAPPVQPQAEPQTKPATNVPQPTPKPAVKSAAKKRGQKAYGAKERSELDRLIETTGGNGNP
ncbi:MAG: CvpA family protein [Alphaproteobacteria bacterium]|nr:CvpA family protein [Alphaproteobacteria bacterium]